MVVCRQTCVRHLWFRSRDVVGSLPLYHNWTHRHWEHWIWHQCHVSITFPRRVIQRGLLVVFCVRHLGFWSRVWYRMLAAITIEPADLRNMQGITKKEKKTANDRIENATSSYAHKNAQNCLTPTLESRPPGGVRVQQNWDVYLDHHMKERLFEEYVDGRHRTFQKLEKYRGTFGHARVKLQFATQKCSWYQKLIL